ncbi:PREDICTED: multidrug resistance-associated protein 9-like [Ceratosolen solmsi marchali]|uniref:Multidrug resistance-associated protein 9-like n=1 Tax=Ceratosolen solmsi marchali TaxID=326594 RepID=A0AAJ7DZS9_9HYME|nr:PREDICTED: multidrug resistance-associated protein 9-like [Ceratosolen solmsi marchali]
MTTLLLQKLLEYSEHSEKHILSGIQWTIYVVGFDLLQTILCTWSDIMNQRTALRLKAACLSLLLKKIIHSNVAYKNMNENPFTYVENYCTEIANDFTKSRMLKTIETINSIKLVKINGWEDHFIENITNIRNRESKWLFKATYLNSLTASMNYIIPFIAIIATFFIHFLMSQHLTTSEAFPICIVFIVQMNDSFISTRKSLYHIKQAVLTLNRIKAGLLLEDTSNHILKPFESSQAVMIINASFAYDIYKKENYQAAMVVETKYESKLVSSEEKQHLTSSIFASKRVEVLFNITFKARKGQLIGVYGPPKCGKSSLLLAALGQMRMTSGQLMRQGSCAYVGQRPWLTQATLGENILFGEGYDAKRYYEAQIVCKLRQDVKELVGGDKYKISDSDNKISEILKQKIALARAFYADRDIYFLDDPLRCMEDTVAEEIFENLIIRALAEKTIIFVTCELKYINRCDYMYIMRDGKIAEHGRHKELMRLGREYASLVKSAIIDAEGDYSDESCKFQKNNSSNVKNDKELSIADCWKIELESEDESYYAINENELGEKKIMTMTYYSYIKSFGGLFMLILLILTYIAFTAIGLITLLRLIWYIETIKSENILVQGVKKNNFESSKSWCGSCFFFIILGCLLKAFIMQYVGNKIADKFHTALLNKLINAPINIFDVTTLKKMKKVFLVDLNNGKILY